MTVAVPNSHPMSDFLFSGAVLATAAVVFLLGTYVVAALGSAGDATLAWPEPPVLALLVAAALLGLLCVGALLRQHRGRSAGQ